MIRATVIVNPAAGHGRLRNRGREARQLALETLRACGFDADVRFTTGPGDARRWAREAAAAGSRLVVAWGGDGTMNEVASALAFGSVPIGLVPAGSGNGLALDLGVPGDPAAALRAAALGRDRTIDAGEIDGRLFFNVAGIGLDAAIAARFANREPGGRGRLGYLHLTASELMTRGAERYAIDIGAERLECEALLIAFANSRQYGNGALIAPAAKIDDGRLDLVVVERQPLVRIVARLPSLFRGTLRDSPGLLMRTIASAGVSGRAPMPFHVDGEPRMGGSMLTVRVRPGALIIRSPAGPA